jgi:cyclopropane fatty-acyl-phospholipid synthase-like methyltransferase
MGFYDDKKTASQYIEMARGYDGEELINILRKHVPQAACVLEIGMGPGVDLRILKKYFQVTGSDNSAFFLDRFRQFDPDADLMNLDAVKLDTGRTFDCIYSNKVLHHLTDEQLAESFLRQKAILSDRGIIMHSFWRGTGSEECQGLKFVNQTEANLRLLVGKVFNIVDIAVYSEMEEDDSLYVLGSV